MANQPLTVYGTNLASTTLGSAMQLLGNTSGAGSAGHDNTLGTASGYSEIFPGGTASAWQALGSIPGAASNNGYLLDSTLLEGQTMPSGTWTDTWRARINGGSGNAVASLYTRVGIRSSSGTITFYGTLSLTAQTLTNGTAANYSVTGSVSQMNFAVGDKLYIERWCNITTPVTGAANVRVDASSSTTVGSTNNQNVTTGYDVTAGGQLTATFSGVGTLAGTLSIPAPATVPYSVKVAGNSVLVQAGTLDIDLAIGKRGSASFLVKQPSTTTHYQQYQTVQINDQNGASIFGGYISLPQEKAPRGNVSPAYLTNQMTCMDYRWITDKRVVYQTGLAPDVTLAPSTSLAPGGATSAQIYLNRPYDVIVQDIYNKYLAPEGVSLGAIFTGPYPSPMLAPSTTLAPNGPSQMISSVIFNYPTVTQALDALAVSASASGVTFYWGIDQNKAFWFVPYSYVANSTVVDGTKVDDGALSGVVPYVTRANPLYRNTQYVVGGTTPGPGRTSYFVGDTTNRTFTLSYPVAGKPYVMITTGGTSVSKSVGIQGTSGNAFYYQVGSNSITQDSSQTALTSSDTLEVHYTPQLPSTASAQNSSQITAQAALDGTTGIVESVVNDTSITSNSDGGTEASQLLNIYCIGNAAFFTFATRIAGYYPGQQITVTYAPFGFSSAKMLVQGVHISDAQDAFNIWYTLTAIIGPYDATWANFFGKLLTPHTTASATAISVGV
jgi:hypothetical protein